MNVQSLYDKLIHELTELDRRLGRRERRVNVSRLALFFETADRFRDLVAKGKTLEEAFAEEFTPWGPMETIAKRLGLNLRIVRGRWSLISARGLGAWGLGAFEFASIRAKLPRYG